MSDILCEWLNKDVRLSKSVEPSTFSKAFSSGYLIGEVLHKHQLQDDFDMFTKSNTSNSKLNNFTRIKPTLHLLGVPFDLTVAQALMQEQQGAATCLLYQLYILLQKKQKAGITGTAMETMQPMATACLQKKEIEIYADRLRTLVKRDAELQLQKISEHYEEQAQQWNNRFMMAQLVQQQEKLKLQGEMRMKDIERLRASRRRPNEIMTRTQASIIQMPRPPPKRSLQTLQRRQQQLRREKQAQRVQTEIAQFEENREKIAPSDFASCFLSGLSLSQGSKAPSQTIPGGGAELVLQSNSEYMQSIRQRLEEDTMARQQREKRRTKFLVEQLKAHEAQQEALREQQLVERLTRQTQQERRLVTQLLQIRMQKEVIRQNRLFREHQYQQQRERELQEALEREAALAQQEKLDHAEEIRKEIELHNRIAAEHAQNRYRKHSKSCREVLEQIVDLVTKVGEYRLLTGNLIPAKLMKEWKELFFGGLPLYESVVVEGQQLGSEPSTQPDLKELKKQELLNNQDYDEYTNMVGEWAWPEEGGEAKPPPANNRILGHIMQRLRKLVHSPAPGTPPPIFPPFTLKACVLGKFFSGKTTCLTKIAQVHSIHVFSANNLIQKALEAYHSGEEQCLQDPKSTELPCSTDTEQQGQDGTETQDNKSPDTRNHEESKKRKLSLRALHGEAIVNLLRTGEAIPDELLVNIMMEAIREVPANSGWILDGFPVDITQARLLEKALGGSMDQEQRDADCKKRNSRANLATEPNAPKKAPSQVPVLNLALLLDVSDDCVLNRAAKNRVKKSVVVAERPEQETAQDVVTIISVAKTGTETDAAAIPTGDKSLEIRNQHRISSFQDTWSKLEKWFGKKQGILVRLDAEVEEEELYRRVETVLQQAMIQTQRAPTSAVAPAVHSTPGEEPDVRVKSSPKSKTHSPREHPRRMSGCSSSNELSQNSTKSPSDSILPRPTSASREYVDEPLPREIPEHLCQYWDTVCDSYVSNVKAVMQNLRSERILIIRHLFNIREEYKHYLGRLDLKQEFLSQWQQNYNSIPDDIRDDDDTKAELHQRLDDLCERLWDICDKRRREDGQERDTIMGNGWLEDHISVLINHYSSLMQVELDRFQDTQCVLRHYYQGMARQALPELPSHFTCIPLLDITERQDTPLEESTEQVSKSSCETDDGEDQRKTKVVPLLSRHPPTSQVVSKSSLQQAESDKPSDEKLISDIYEAALTAISNLVTAEAHQRNVEVSEESQSQQEAMEKTPQATARADRDKNKKKKWAGKKKGISSPLPEPSPPVIEESLEEIQRREVRAKIHKEYATALAHEENAANVRVGLVRACALVMVRSLHSRAKEAFSSMEKWLAARYLAEINSIDRLAEVVRSHIESGCMLQNEMVLESTDFYLNGDLLVVTIPPPPPHPGPLEIPTQSTLNVAQLQSFYTQLYNVAPSGLMSGVEFFSALQDINFVKVGCDPLPEPWIRMTETQLTEMVSLLTQEAVLLDWRQFLLSAALPWPIPSLTQLLAVRRRLQAADLDKTGYINMDQYLQIEWWFHSETAQCVPQGSSQPLPNDHLASLHEFFFQLFADHLFSPPCLDYVSMLQYLAAHPDPAQGFLRALSVVLGQHLKQPSTSQLVKSMPNIEETMEFGSPEVEGDEKKEGEPPCGSSSVFGEQGVPIPALLAVICHKGPRLAEHSCFYPACRTLEEHTEDLVRIFRELGYGPEDHIPFSSLIQHYSIQKLIEGSPHYQLIDVHRVLRDHQNEEEAQSSTAL
ncbi:sperm flagellar protein 2 [Lampris incognitus]|uniref:sperm flagellar protein 2 n=1 Tax=Lampris incognitus TaxID=2546036 RepID=UPI0024B55B70|nr:sperm flagellar protein 2 [Lampris incognitus]